MKSWILAAATIIMLQGTEITANQWNLPPSCQKPCPQQPCPKPPKHSCTKQSCSKPLCPPSRPNPCCPPVCFEQGLVLDPHCVPPAYSTPAGISIRDGQDIRFSLSILYWEAMQGGMDLAVPGQANSVSPVTGLVPASATGHGILKQEFDYKPGFKMGFAWLGAKDNWVVYGEYTRLYGKSKTSMTNPPGPGGTSVNGVPLPGHGVWIPTSWLPSPFYANQAKGAVGSEWKYGIDLLDGQISRPFYSGTHYTVEPFFGARAAWIDQKFKITAVNLPTTAFPTAQPTQSGRYSSDSWGVGPRIGMNGNWHFGKGVRLMGNAAASLLFTQYTRISEKVDSPDLGGLPINVDIKKVNTLRPNMDLSLGLGWGSYYYCRRVYIDLAASYDFSIFWEQNMMRSLADEVVFLSNPSGAAANLYLHGLTVRIQTNF